MYANIDCIMERYFEPNSCGVSSLPHPEKQDQRQQQAQGEDEDDPLDAFMAGINQTIAKEKEESEAKLQSGVTGGSRGERFFDDEDVAADSVEYLQSLKAKVTPTQTIHAPISNSFNIKVSGNLYLPCGLLKL